MLQIFGTAAMSSLRLARKSAFSRTTLCFPSLNCLVVRNSTIIRRSLISNPELVQEDAASARARFKISKFLPAPSVIPIPALVVEQSITKAISAKILGQDQGHSFNDYLSFVKCHQSALVFLKEFVRLSYNEKELGLLSSVELTNVLYQLREMVNRKKLPSGMKKVLAAELDSMIDAFMILLLTKREADLPVASIVVSVMQSGAESEVLQRVFEAGLGDFLSEISILPKQFDLATLLNFSPIVEGILWLEKEFSQILESSEQIYDESFFKTLIPVMRYRHLLCALQNLQALGGRPVDLQAVIQNPIAKAIQEDLTELTGTISFFDELVFGPHRNFINAIYCFTGLSSFESIFAALLENDRKNKYSDFERSIILNFLASFMPLVCNGKISSTQLSNPKYLSAIVKNKNFHLQPYKFGDDIFENYEFSLLVYHHFADFLYIVKGVCSSVTSFKSSSILELEAAITSFAAEKGPYVKDDCQNFLDDLKLFGHNTLRGYFILDELISKAYLARTLNSVELFVDITPLIMKPRVTLISVEEETQQSAGVSGSFFELYSHELLQLREEDLKMKYESLSTRVVSGFCLRKYIELKEMQDFSDEILYPRLFRDLSYQLEDLLEDLLPTLRILDEIADEEQRKESVAHNAYVQIPDNLHVHDFAHELEEFQKLRLLGKFECYSPSELLILLDEEIEVLESTSVAELSKELSKELSQLTCYYKLRLVLSQLFALNGGNTGILDSVVFSDKVFAKLEAKLEDLARIAQKENELASLKIDHKEYSQLPDNCPLDTFIGELSVLQDEIGGRFSEVETNVILETLQILSHKSVNTDQARVLQKLHRNLEVLFRSNNNHTAVLDAIITNDTAFNKFESSRLKKVLSKEPAKNTVASYQKELAEQRQDLVVERTGTANATEANEVLLEENVRSQKYLDTENSAKSDLEEFLRKAKDDKVSEMEEKFREREAFVWSASMLRNYGTLETKQFFSPVAKNRFPMFPGTDNNLEYLVLTAQGDALHSSKNPLGSTHIPEDMFIVLERLAEPEIVKFSPHLAKLQRKGWNLIGLNGQNQMLVLSRPLQTYKSSFLKTAKHVLAIAGLIFISLLSINYFVNEPVQSVDTANDTTGKKQSEIESEDSISSEVSNILDAPMLDSKKKSTWWKGLLWK